MFRNVFTKTFSKKRAKIHIFLDLCKFFKNKSIFFFVLLKKSRTFAHDFNLAYYVFYETYSKKEDFSNGPLGVFGDAADGGRCRLFDDGAIPRADFWL